MTESLPAAADCPTVDGIPLLGLGTWQNDDPEQCARTVATALETGYRHVDTAQIYRNEAAVGDGIERADVPREDVFLATKVWIDDLGYEDAIETTEASLDRLGVDRVDLLYVHWPAGAYDPEETLAAFAELRNRGLIDAIGVSNFPADRLDEAIETCEAPIVANQFECHPFLPNRDLVEHCRERDVVPVAYSPLARGQVLDDPEIGAVADEHGVTPAQIGLAWLRERGIAEIPKATSDEHVRDNWASLALDLSDDDLARIDGIERRERLLDPGFGPW